MTKQQSNIEKLIAEHCPNGVELKALGDVCDSTSNIKWQDCVNQSFKYIDLTSVDRVTHAYSQVQTINAETAPSRAQQIVKNGDVIFGTTRPTLRRFSVIGPDYNGQICSTGFCVLRPNPEAILTDFLFHLIGSSKFYDYVEATQKGASYPSISDREVKKFRIPLPPLAVQEEIVKILNSFTELEAELEARKQQYEHYRSELLTFGDVVRWTKLGEIFKMFAGRQISAVYISDYKTENHPFPCYGGNGIRGFVAMNSHDVDCLFIGRQGALCGNIKRTKGKFYATEHAVVVTSNADVDLDWAYHMLTGCKLSLL